MLNIIIQLFKVSIKKEENESGQLPEAGIGISTH